METEIWKYIEGFGEKYQVSNLGNVYNTQTKYMRKLSNSNGYKIVKISNSYRYFFKSVHRLVAIAFIPNPENKPQVNHKNGIKHDNRVENLEWCTSRENIRHAYDVLGKKNPSGINNTRFGKKNPNYYLTEAYKRLYIENKKIYDELMSGAGAYFLARKYNKSPQTIYNIRNRHLLNESIY